MLLYGNEPGLDLVAAAFQPPPAQTLTKEGFEGREVRRRGLGRDAGLLAGDDAEAALKQRGFELFELLDGKAGAFDDVAKRIGQKHHGMRQMDHA
jgi:hypothetical protein